MNLGECGQCGAPADTPCDTDCGCSDECPYQNVIPDPKPIDFVSTRDDTVGMSDTPTLSKITKHNGVAGQVSYSVDVTYPYEAPETITFVGSVYGGPVVMVTPNTPTGGVFVTDPARHGTFGVEWVRRFFS